MELIKLVPENVQETRQVNASYAKDDGKRKNKPHTSGQLDRH